MRKPALLIPALAFAVALPLMTGCSSEQKTTEVTTTQSQPVQTTTTTTTTDEGHDSLLGATGHFVWTVIAFPFRVVGDVIGEIV